MVRGGGEWTGPHLAVGLADVAVLLPPANKPIGSLVSVATRVCERIPKPCCKELRCAKTGERGARVERG